MTPTTLNICRKSLAHTAYLLGQIEGELADLALIHVLGAQRNVKTMLRIAESDAKVEVEEA